jgi:protein-disulfide isomerase
MAQQSTPLSTAEQNAIRALILKTIRENPEAVVEAIQSYQAKLEADAAASQREAIARLGEALQSDKNAPVLGNPDGKTIIVEFFDYNCPYCRRAAPEVMALIAEDDDLRVVMREWPILGPDSETAARASLAARAQGKYAQFHETLMAQPRANEAAIRRAAELAGLDFDRLQTDMRAPEVDAHIAQSHELAQQLGINGTPSFVVGDNLIPGFVEKAQLAALISKTRKGTGGQ